MVFGFYKISLFINEIRLSNFQRNRGTPHKTQPWIKKVPKGNLCRVVGILIIRWTAAAKYHGREEIGEVKYPKVRLCNRQPSLQFCNQLLLSSRSLLENGLAKLSNNIRILPICWSKELWSFPRKSNRRQPHLKNKQRVAYPITNPKTQRQTEAEAVTINKPQGRRRHSITNWDRTAFLHPSMFQPYIVVKIY